jgi:hypothetical protein
MVRLYDEKYEAAFGLLFYYNKLVNVLLYQKPSPMKAITFILLSFLSLPANKFADFSYTDDCGNTIVVDEKASLPAIIDNQFLKENISSKYFGECDGNEQPKVNCRITSFIKKGRMCYELVVVKQPIDRDIETMLRHGFGYIHYKMKLKKVKGIITLESVEYLYSEL